MIKKILLGLNIALALFTAIDFVIWAFQLPSTTLLWHSGVVLGYAQVVIFSLIIIGFCMMPSILFLDLKK